VGTSARGRAGDISAGKKRGLTCLIPVWKAREIWGDEEKKRGGERTSTAGVVGSKGGGGWGGNRGAESKGEGKRDAKSEKQQHGIRGNGKRKRSGRL